MQVNRISLYIIFSLLFLSILGGLKGQSVNDNGTRVLMDSIRRSDSIRSKEMPTSYLKLKENSKKSGFGKQLYRLLIKEPRIKLVPASKSSHAYDKYAGKVIRNIYIQVNPPFRDPQEGFLKFLNKSHVKTKDSTIKSYLQFKKNQTVNPALIVTSEADLRNASFISNATITIDSIPNSIDSVDVNILVRDKWTIGLNLHNLSTSRVAFEVYDANILGSGSRAGLDFRYSNKYIKRFQENKKYGFGFNYLYRNIGRQNIEMEGLYNDKIESIDILLRGGRPIQPKYRYFGEIRFERHEIRPELVYWDSISPNKKDEVSLTVGKTFNYSKQNYVNQFVLAARVKSQYSSYDYQPYAEYMSKRLKKQEFSNYTIFLLQASLFKNTYRQEYMVYNVGTTEDIALGYNITGQIGYSKSKLYNESLYGSLSVSIGLSSKDGGSLYLRGEIGSSVKKRNFFGGVLKMEMRYFTPVKKVFGAYLRQFINVKYSQIMNDKKYFDDYVYIGELTTLKMPYWRRDEKGKHLLLIQNETDVFAPFQLAGFRFTFYSFFDFGWLSQSKELLRHDNFNYGFGGGIRLRNNFIVFNTIDIKFGVYPKMIQNGFDNYYRVTSSSPRSYPNFIPEIPNEITP